MTVTDQIKILDRKIKQNEAQYDLDKKAAKISPLSSKKLDKCEYLTGEDLGLKPSTVEQIKSEYSALGNIFNKGLKEEDKKEGLFKRVENIKGKTEELLNAFSAANKVSKAAFSAANKVSKAAKSESDYNYDSKYAFYNFYRDFKKFKRMSLDSKYDEMIDFYELLNSFINTHEAITTETKGRKDRILSYFKPLYNKFLDTSIKNYDSEKVKGKEKRGRDYKKF